MIKKLFMCFLCLLMICPAACGEAAETPILEVHQMALGIADGYLLRCGDVTILIDGGNAMPGNPKDEVVSYLRAAGVDTIDVYIISHWHLDHCMNMNVVLSEFGGEGTVTYGASDVPPDEIDYEGRKIPIGPVVNGVYQQMLVDDVIQLGPLTITCIGPDSLAQNGRCNSDSLNFVLQYGTRRMLFTGDYAQSGEINKRHPELCSDVDVLKFPHHGGKPYEIGNIACRTASPEYVLIPSQLNAYQVYQFIRGNGVPLEREKALSNRNGHVVILTDGGDYIEALSDQNPADYAPKAE